VIIFRKQKTHWWRWSQNDPTGSVSHCNRIYKRRNSSSPSNIADAFCDRLDLDSVFYWRAASRGPSVTAELSVFVDCSDGELQRHHWRHDHEASRQNLWTWVSHFISRRIFRSTLQSRPNKAGLKCPSVRTSVCPQKVFFPFNKIWHVGRGRWVMHDGMQYYQIQGQGQGHETFKVGNPSIFNAISSTIYNGSWQLTTDS